MVSVGSFLFSFSWRTLKFLLGLIAFVWTSVSFLYVLWGAVFAVFYVLDAKLFMYDFFDWLPEIVFNYLLQLNEFLKIHVDKFGMTGIFFYTMYGLIGAVIGLLSLDKLGIDE